MNDRQLREELTSILIRGTKLHHSSINKVAAQLMPLLLDGARYRWVAGDPAKRGSLQSYEGKDEMDRFIDAERSKAQP